MRTIEDLPLLKGPKIHLKTPGAKDIPRICELLNEPEVSAYTLFIPHPYREKDAIFWLNMGHQGLNNQNQFIFGIYKNDSGEFIGGIDLRLERMHRKGELGYWLGKPHWNQGLMTEALELMISWAMEDLKVNKIIALHDVDNPASGRVMEKCGMIKEATLIDHFFVNKKFTTLHQYYINKNHYYKTH
ncbi:GNAT family N-acetyltransferase [Persicobacter sp. CCB-QB2]|uniref:GNAT family N-acetyltransferase n=1 Tax=Persicobacter sp. CCB-QB2 TaxID=1561025 RepID=UPI0006A9F45D|nr:GNAT family N-acetyltransferase [Persicobacter sp. CCB-QB2]